MEALIKLGGNASLVAIYNIVEENGKTDLSKYIDQKSKIRKNAYLHSIDTDIFNYTVGGEMDLSIPQLGKVKGFLDYEISKKQFK